MEQITKWGENTLNNQGHIVIEKEIKIETHGGSSVWKYITINGNFFLKYMTKDFLHELPTLGRKAP
ncbi:MAG: hypothetical protein H0U78_03365 [Rickettsiaceae bacterium]|nr:hypothetical protein [Rickettsiaceae bacterium]